MVGKQILKFPRGFLWGAATAAHQVEGNNLNSDWWAWEHSVKRYNQLKAKGQNPEDFYSGAACDSYNRYEEDFSLAQHLNQNAHRLSIEWARIEPREGEISEPELDHYEKVLQSAKVHGLATFVTLHHFTNPKWFADKGGWEKMGNVKYFVDYCEVVARRLGQYVDFWITINEPELYVSAAYLSGAFPPHHKSLWKAYYAVNNVAIAHNRAYEKLKFLTGKPVSMAYNIQDLQSTGSWVSKVNVFVRKKFNRYVFHRTVDRIDFIGLNYYFHHHVGWLGPRRHSESHHDVSDVGWGIHPEGLEPVLLSLKHHNKPIYITENGLADAKDRLREQFIKDHLYFIHRAIQQGCDVRGYLHWSLMDNFEWEKGFAPRFGLVEIDRDDLLRRRVRGSALAYATICKNNAMEY